MEITPEGIEARLRRTLGELLEMDAAHIDPDVPVTAFGVNSGTAVTILSEMEGWSGVPLPLEVFLGGPSITEIAQEIMLTVTQLETEN